MIHKLHVRMALVRMGYGILYDLLAPFCPNRAVCIALRCVLVVRVIKASI